MFLYYANEKSDDVIGGSTKTIQHSIINISKYIKAVFFTLGSRNIYHKRIKFIISRFSISSSPKNLIGRVNTIWEPCVFRARRSVPFKRFQMTDTWFFTERDWRQECCHGNSNQ